MPSDYFNEVVGACLDETVIPAKMFGADGLKVNGKFFAMEYKGNFVTKLPKERVDELVVQGIGAYFDPGMGKIMKEWVAVASDKHDQWSSLAQESKQFVASLHK